jgi:hypothetical protein
MGAPAAEQLSFPDLDQAAGRMTDAPGSAAEEIAL